MTSGGRGRPVQQLAQLRQETAELRDRLLKGELDPRIAAVGWPANKHGCPADRPNLESQRAAGA
jgi:hypothetical protein